MKPIRFIALLIPVLIQCQESSEKSPLESSQEQTEITQWRGPDRNGIYPEKNLLKEWPEGGPEMIWKFEGLGIGYTTVAVTEKTIFTTGTHDSTSYIYALDHDGNLLWKKEYGYAWMTNYPGARSTPLIYDGLGYLLSGRGVLVCFSPDNGDTVWTKDLFNEFDGENIRFGITENLLIDGDKLFCTPGGGDANVVALDRVNGELIWKSQGNGELSAYCSPRIIEHNGRRFLVTITAKSAISIDPENGDLVWSHDLNDPDGIHGNIPLYHNGYLFTMNGWGNGSIMLKLSDDGTAVEEAWRSHLFDLEHGDVVRIGNNIYGTDHTSRLFACVDWETGAIKDTLKEYASGSVIAADSMIYCYAYNGDVALIKPLPEGFKVVSSFKAPGVKRDHIAHPVIKDGILYLRYANELMAYAVGADMK